MQVNIGVCMTKNFGELFGAYVTSDLTCVEKSLRFLLITKPLLNIQTVKHESNPTGRRTRWSIELSGYDFEILYKKSEENGNADCLPRISPSENIQDNSVRLCIVDGFVSCKTYDKRDDFDFGIVNFPFLDGDFRRAASYGVFIFQN